MCVFWITDRIPVTFLFIFLFVTVMFGQRVVREWLAHIYMAAVKVMAHLEKTGNLLMSVHQRTLLTVWLTVEGERCQRSGERLPFSSDNYD